MLGIGVAGGVSSPSGDKPITISYIQPGSAAGRARLKVSFIDQIHLLFCIFLCVLKEQM